MASNTFTVDLIEPADMSMDLIEWHISAIERQLSAFGASVPGAYQAFADIRLPELRAEKERQRDVAQRFAVPQGGLGVPGWMFMPDELHHTEHEKVVTRLQRELDLIEEHPVTAPARVAFLEQRIKDFKAFVAVDA